MKSLCTGSAVRTTMTVEQHGFDIMNLKDGLHTERNVDDLKESIHCSIASIWESLDS